MKVTNYYVSYISYAILADLNDSWIPCFVVLFFSNVNKTLRGSCSSVDSMEL